MDETPRTKKELDAVSEIFRVLLFPMLCFVRMCWCLCAKANGIKEPVDLVGLETGDMSYSARCVRRLLLIMPARLLLVRSSACRDN